MAKTDKETADLVKIVADGIAAGMNAHVPKKVTVGQYIKQHLKKVKLKREAFQNGYRIPDDKLSDEETRLLNGLHRSGRYIDRKVEVIVRPEPDNAIEFRYNDRSVEQRMELAHHFRNFEELLQKITDEQAKLDITDKKREEALRKLEAIQSVDVEEVSEV